jgi:serine/threonine protein kinase
MPPPSSSQSPRERDPYIGRVVDGRFTLLSRIGRGGMGLVYRAQQAPLERSVALKVLIGAGEEDRESEFQRRFYREAATAAKLKHPNTITVFDYGSSMLDEQRIFWIAMELLEGQTLSRALAKGKLQPARVVNISLQICRSLREAHGAGIVHRDLKPGNIMLLRQDDSDEPELDFVKVLDFGLAKTFLSGPEPALTRAGTFLGSPRYVAPEQVEARPVDPRTDIYSYGCVLYRMLTGVVPFDGEAPVEIMMKHLEEDAAPIIDPEIPDELCELCLQCLEKQAHMRPESMQEVVTRLKRARSQLGHGAFWDEPSDVVAPSDAGASAVVRRAQPEVFEAPPAELSDPKQQRPYLPAMAPPPVAPDWVGQVALDEQRPSHSMPRGRGLASSAALFVLIVLLAGAAAGIAGRRLGWYHELPLPAWARTWLVKGPASGGEL